ncbi:MAG: hypothetical protein GY859_37830, partial [Desulfobacterales bacterium]|nr:hypothetical protein [Desulfobacterales bacterium]
MKHVNLKFVEILMIIVCMLAASEVTGFAYNPDAGLSAASVKKFGRVENGSGSMAAKMARVRMPFIANKRQMDESVLFYANTFGGTVFVTREGKIVYSLPFREKEENAGKAPGEAPGLPGSDKIKKITKGVALREELVKGSVKRIRGEGAAATKVTFLKGRDPSKWKRDVGAYEMVSLGEVYDGVDVKLRAHGNNVEKLFFIRPGADPGAIRIRLEGAGGLKITDAGGLELETALGSVSFTAPAGRQEVDGTQRPVEVDYVVEGDAYGFKVGKYDGTRELVIDPLLASTFVGGGGYDEGRALALAPDGSVYAAGFTQSIGFPTTTGAYDEDFNGSRDIFVLKMDGDLTTILASTFMGGGDEDKCLAMALGPDGSVYIGGETLSDDYPTTPGALAEARDHDGMDAIISRLSGDLDTLLASTLLGGLEDDIIMALALDSGGSVYAAGSTASSSFPTTPDAYADALKAGSEAFVSKLDGGLATLSASTFLGGSGDDFAYALTLAPNGSVYVTGRTASRDFPATPGANGETYNGGTCDAFISRLNGDLTALLGATLLGGEEYDEASDAVMDPAGNIYVVGRTYSPDFPTTPGAYCKTPDALGNLFVSRLDGALATLSAATLLHGKTQILGNAVALGPHGSVYVSGSTYSREFPTTAHAYANAFNDYSDGFVTKLDPDLTSLSSSTFLGGDNFDYIWSLAVDPAGSAYVTGATRSMDYPTTPGAYESNPGAGWDLFVSKLDSDLSAAPYPPFIEVMEPDGADDRVNLVKTGTYTIRWEDRASGDGAVSLYYDTDDNGSDGALIVGGVAENDESDQYVWDVSALPEGVYYVYAALDDGVHPTAAAYSAGPVEIIHNEPPVIQVLAPDGTHSADLVFSIVWSDFDPDDAAAVSLYYDADDHGEDGSVIALAMNEDDETDQYAWDVSALPEGNYWVYAVIDDGINPPVVDYAAGPLTVHHPPRLTISLPSGGLVSRPGLGTFTYSLGAIAPLRAAPAPGHEFVEWTGDVATVADVHAAATTITMNGSYTIAAGFAKNQAPSIQVLAPDGAGDVVADSFVIGWSDSDPDDDASISLHHDTDNAGENGVLIADAIRENDGANQYTWDVSALPEGSYWVYAVINDGINPPVVDYSAGPLTVRHNCRLTISPPSNGLVGAPGPGTFTYSFGAVVPLTAAPAPGHVFIEWTGDASTIANVYDATTTITMRENSSVAAIFAINQAPAIQILAPDDAGDDADASFLIRWSDSDPDDDASISLYYDTDDAGRCGVLIVDAIRENDGADQYTWDLSMLPEGEYWVYAVIDDGANAPVVDYGAG